MDDAKQEAAKAYVTKIATEIHAILEKAAKERDQSELENYEVIDCVMDAFAVLALTHIKADVPNLLAMIAVRMLSDRFNDTMQRGITARIKDGWNI